jgi:tetratricopeptide (TPR) repeat protein
MIPLLITAWDVLTLTGPRLRRIVFTTAPLWAIAAIIVAVKNAGYDSDLSGHPGVFSVERLMLVLTVYWLDLRSLVWPVGLTLHYEMPRSFGGPGVVFGGIAVAASVALVWGLRRRRLVLFGLLWFLITLAPTLQLAAHHIFHADRYLYLPMVGLAVAVALLVQPLGYRLQYSSMIRPAVAALIVALAVGISALAALEARTIDQLQTWRSRLAVWEQCLRVNPASSKANDAYADNLFLDKQYRRAIAYYEEALRLDPGNEGAVVNLVRQLTGGPPEFRDYAYAVPLIEEYCRRTDWKNRELLDTMALACGNLAVELDHRGQYRPAIEYYEKAIWADPTYTDPLFNLALLLATCEVRSLRAPEQAVRLSERACSLAEQPDANGFWILATACAEAGRFERACEVMQEAVTLAEAAGDSDLASRMRDQANRYRQQARVQKAP